MNSSDKSQQVSDTWILACTRSRWRSSRQRPMQPACLPALHWVTLVVWFQVLSGSLLSSELKGHSASTDWKWLLAESHILFLVSFLISPWQLQSWERHTHRTTAQNKNFWLWRPLHFSGKLNQNSRALTATIQGHCFPAFTQHIFTGPYCARWRLLGLINKGARGSTWCLRAVWWGCEVRETESSRRLQQVQSLWK